MEITSVTVSVHEKRNHPHEFGHYDCDVRFTADLEEGEDADQAIRMLRHRAGVQVAAECDAWVEGIEEAILSQQEEYARRREQEREELQQQKEAEQENWESLEELEELEDEEDEQPWS